jgi:tetratricopeptide (TPR) repeat protein
MNTKSDFFLDELIETQVKELIQDDDYYQGLATPLKSVALCKQEHREKLTEFFKFKEQRALLDQAQKLIMDLMPAFIPPIEFTKIKEELDNSGSHFAHFMESRGNEKPDRPILFQEMMGLSNETLLHIYALGLDLHEKGLFKDGLALFTLLTFLAPHVTSYWILEGTCLQSLNQHQEALAALSAAKLLNPSDPLPIAYSIESYRSLKEKDQLLSEIQLLEKVVNTLDSEEKGIWRDQLNNIKNA